MIDWRHTLLNWRWVVTLAICIAISLGILVMSETSHRRLTAGYQLALSSMWATARLGELRSVLLDAESSQRGYLLTGGEYYLKPYHRAVERAAVLDGEIGAYYVRIGDKQSRELFADIVAEMGAKVRGMDLTLRMAREGRSSAAIEWVRTDIGKLRMDQFSERINALQGIERDRTANLVAEWRNSLTLSRVGIATIAALNIVLLVLLFRWLKRDWQRSRDREIELDGQVRQRTEQLARLSAHLQEVSETEKTRLGRELHDELGAILTATRLDLLWVLGRLRSGESQLQDKLKGALANLDQGIAVKRRIIEDLRPSILSTFGLVTAARETAEQFAERAGWRLVLDLPPDDPDLDEDIEIAMFRILQESLNNASKYAKASQVRVSLQCDLREGGTCTLEIEDNGVGFRPDEVRPSAHGLVGMRQRVEPRGGSLLIRSGHRKGTLLRATVPIRLNRQPNDTAAASLG